MRERRMCARLFRAHSGCRFGFPCFASSATAHRRLRMLRTATTSARRPTTLSRSFERTKTAMSAQEDVLRKFAEVVPPLDFNNHKGEAGRIAIVGGSKEYTGAPFYAGMSALRAGADLCYVFCHEAAAVPLKSYSPELIVYPVQDGDLASTNVDALCRCHAIVIGPGLGRSASSSKMAKDAIRHAVREKIPVVLDADSLWMLSQDLELLPPETEAILTPNVVEYSRLLHAASLEPPSSAEVLCCALGTNVVINVKGAQDRIVCAQSSESSEKLHCSQRGSPRRSGGQGDVLSGLTALFAAWVSIARRKKPDQEVQMRHAAYVASVLTRRCSQAAFQERKRAALASDLLTHIGPEFEAVYPAMRDDNH